MLNLIRKFTRRTTPTAPTALDIHDMPAHAGFVVVERIGSFEPTVRRFATLKAAHRAAQSSRANLASWNLGARARVTVRNLETGRFA